MEGFEHPVGTDRLVGDGLMPRFLGPVTPQGRNVASPGAGQVRFTTSPLATDASSPGELSELARKFLPSHFFAEIAAKPLPWTRLKIVTRIATRRARPVVPLPGSRGGGG